MFFNHNTSGKLGFNQVASVYDVGRPQYPDALFQAVAQAISAQPSFDKLGLNHIVEIGSGTGQATTQLRRATQQLSCVEPGSALASILRDRFAHDPAVTIVPQFFEDFSPTEDMGATGAADLVFSASALHWVPQEIAYDKIRATLRPGGWLAAAWTIPAVSPAAYQAASDIINAAAGNFDMPQPSKAVDQHFAVGFDDFKTNRGFHRCQQHRFQITETRSAAALTDLLWSYCTTDVHAPERTQLRQRLDALGKQPGSLQITHHYWLALGQLLPSASP